MIRDMGNVELFELCEKIPKVQCSECFLNWKQGAIYCTCGHIFVASGSSQNFSQWRMDLLSFPHSFARHGKMWGTKRGRPTLANPVLAILIWPILANPILANPFLAIVVLARPILAKANFGQSNFGQSNFLANPIFYPTFLVSWWAPKGGGPNPGKVRAPKLWGPEGWGPEGWGPEGWGPGGGPNGGGPKFRAFFSLSRHNFLFFFPSLLVFFVEFWWCLKRRCAQMCMFGVLGLSCASPGGPVWWGRRGFTRQPESPNVHIWGSPSSKTPPKFNEKDQQEREKRIKTVAGEGKKERNFGRSGGGGSGGRGVRRRGPEHTHHTHTTTTQTHTTNKQKQTTQNTFPHQNQPQTTHKKKGLAKNGLAKIGWPNTMAKNGLAKIGLAKVGLNPKRAFRGTRHGGDVSKRIMKETVIRVRDGTN